MILFLITSIIVVYQSESKAPLDNSVGNIAKANSSDKPNTTEVVEKKLEQQVKQALVHENEQQIPEYDQVSSPFEFAYGSPEALYNKHIEQAKDGNAESQFFTHMALQECTGTAKTYEQYSENLEKNKDALADMSDVIIAIEERFHRCRALNDIIGKDQELSQYSIKQLSNMWLKASIKNGYPIAVSFERLSQRPKDFSDDEKRESLQKSIRLKRYEAYAQVSSYYLNNLPQKDVIRSQAWLAVACTVNPKCSTDKFMEDTTAYLSSTEYVQVEKNTKRLMDAISREDWDKLEIFQSVDVSNDGDG